MSGERGEKRMTVLGYFSDLSVGDERVPEDVLDAVKIQMTEVRSILPSMKCIRFRRDRKSVERWEKNCSECIWRKPKPNRPTFCPNSTCLE